MSEKKSKELQTAPGAVLLTGASSGIGQALARRLCLDGWTVYGIGRHFPADTAAVLPKNFHPVVCDLLDTGRLLDIIRKLRQQVSFQVLINNAGCAWYGPHESLTTDEISQIIRTDLEVPMILTREFLPSFRQRGGTFLYIASVTAVHTSNPRGAAYAAAKTGLLSFARSLREETRRSAVKVATILPGMTQTGLYRNADFEADPASGASLLPDDVAAAASYVLSLPAEVCVPELVIEPQHDRIRRK